MSELFDMGPVVIECSDPDWSSKMRGEGSGEPHFAERQCMDALAIFVLCTTLLSLRVPSKPRSPNIVKIAIGTLNP